MTTIVSNNVRDFVLPVCNLGHDAEGDVVKHSAELPSTNVTGSYS